MLIIQMSGESRVLSEVIRGILMKWKAIPIIAKIRIPKSITLMLSA